ncbi:hypothetical protein [Kineococcus arenarius]|uniref:hypothetical protein n=1 Tax=Kineococcus sp. SYSU DK007 TaxID=3383128 RepID=UPI003D7C4A5A
MSTPLAARLAALGEREVAAVLAAAVRASCEECLRLLEASRPARFAGTRTLFTANRAENPTQNPGEHPTRARGRVHAPGRLVVHHVPQDHTGAVSNEGWSVIGPLLDADPAVRTEPTHP